MELPGGFSLTELLLAVALLTILAGLSAPSFQDLQLNATRANAVNQFVQSIHLARGEAMKRNGVVSLCASAGAASCETEEAQWNNGWIVFVNGDADVPAVRDADENLLYTYPAWPRGRITSNRATLSFRAFGQTGVTSTFTFCDIRGSREARAVIISQTGRPRVSNRSAADTALTCPAP